MSFDYENCKNKKMALSRAMHQADEIHVADRHGFKSFSVGTRGGEPSGYRTRRVVDEEGNLVKMVLEEAGAKTHAGGVPMGTVWKEVAERWPDGTILVRANTIAKALEKVE